jgi:hypothetical protein
MTLSSDQARADEARATLLHHRQFCTPSEQAVIDQRLGAGFTRIPGARDYLVSLAIDAGYSFTQIAELLRSGRGDERSELLDMFGGGVTPEPLDETRRRLVG